MSVYPKADYRPIASKTDTTIVPVGVILHVDAGHASSLHHWFGGDHDSDGDNADGPSKGIESHFHVRVDGHVEQYRDTQIDADANYKGNAFYKGGVRYGFISVETEGYGNGRWTAEQLLTITEILTWVFDVHPWIERRVCPAWDQSGVGYHVMWGAPGAWTNVPGKTCPGPHRIDQFYDIIVPWLESGESMATQMTRPTWCTDKIYDDLIAAGWHTAYPAAGITRDLEDWQADVFMHRQLQTVEALEKRLKKLEAVPPSGMTAAQVEAFNDHQHPEGKTGKPIDKIGA